MNDDVKGYSRNAVTPLGAGGEESGLTEREQIYRELFDTSPMGIWEEDWSLIKAMIDGLVEQGITDWQQYFSLHEEQLLEAYNMASVTHINQAALDLYEASSRQEAIDDTDAEDLLPGELQSFLKTLDAFSEGRRTFDIEADELTYKDNVVTTRRHVAIPLDHQNSWSRVLYMIEDITEHRRMEAALRESEARYREIFDDAPAALWVEDWSPVKVMVDQLHDDGVEDIQTYFADNRDRVIEAHDSIVTLQISNANLEIYGATRDTGTGDSGTQGSDQDTIVLREELDELGSDVLPEEIDAFIRAILSFAKGNWMLEVESWDDKSDGSKILVRSRGIIPPAHRHNWSQVIYTLEDVTERNQMEVSLRESEARYREIFDDSPAVMWVEDWSQTKLKIEELRGDGVEDWRAYFAKHRDKLIELYDSVEVLQTSSASLELYGATNAVEYFGSDRGSIVLLEELDAFVEVLVIFLEGQWKFDIESLDAKSDGAKIMVRTRGVIPPAHRHDWSRLIYTIEDITERKQAEKQLRLAMVEKDLAYHRMSEFLAHMSHELRTPMNAIIGFSQVMMVEMFGAIKIPKYLEYAKDIHASGVHLLGIINDILDLSKVEAGMAELQEENVNVWEALKTCLILLADQAKAAGVSITSDADASLPRLYADELKLKQILINILSNAIKFTPADGTISVITQIDKNNGYVFHITDTGIGIAPEDISRALSPFQQIENILSSKSKGSGLGLPLTKTLTELHGGSLDIQSEVDVGTTVTVRFPADRTVLEKA